MKKTFLSLIVMMAAAVQLQAIDYTKYVNPFIGTQTDETGALSGSTFPGPTMPQGMVQLAPETEQYVTWDPCCGYDFNKDSIFGFTHTHLALDNLIGTTAIVVGIATPCHTVEVQNHRLLPGILGEGITMNTCMNRSREVDQDALVLQLDHIEAGGC